MSQPFLSVELVVLTILLSTVVRHLVVHAKTLPDRRFVLLASASGLLAVLTFGTAFHTILLAKPLGLPIEGIDDHRLSWIKIGIALSAVGLSIYEAKLRLLGKQPRRCWSKGIAFALVVLSVGAYFRFGDVGHWRFYHQHEFFHYYLGSKYNRELGYERLYRCVAVAQQDLGQGDEVRARKMMDLATDLQVPARTALDHADECRDRFTPARWQSFTTDVALMRRSVRLEYWNGMQTDHGYNPPPVWTMMGHLWSSIHPATEGYLQFLSLFDLGLFAGMFAAIGWAFGWRVFAVAAIFWGCQQPADYYWTGGAFLRQDWLFCLVLSACLIRKRLYAWAGAAFAYSALLRVFPGVLLVGWGTVAVAHVWRHRRVAPSHLSVMLGSVAATLFLVSLSIVVTGAGAYSEFYKHILLHKRTPLTNNMGLETVLSQSYSGRAEFVRDGKLDDPFERWETLRRQRLRAFRPFQVVLLSALGLVFVKVIRRVRSLWVAQTLGLAVVISVVELTCYYYSMFILAALLSRFRRGVEQWVLCVACMSQLLAVNRYISSIWFDDRYVAESILFCVFALSLLLAYWPPSKTPAPRPFLLPRHD